MWATAVCCATVGLVAVSAADTVDLKNPGFETGNFRAWETFEDGGGDWLVYRKGDEIPAPRLERGGPGGGFLTSFPKPPQGKHAAFAIQEAPGLNILHRVLRPRKKASVNKLRFFLFYRNTHERFYSPNDFEFGGGEPEPRGILGPPGDANQQVRVDLLKRRAPLDSLQERHVLATLLRTRANADLRRPYRKLGANLTKLGIRKPFRLRIAEVDNRGPLYVGVDGLKLKFKP